MNEYEVRVSLVEQNYKHLENRLTKVEIKLDEIKDEMNSGQQQLIKIIIGTTGTVIVSLLGTIGVILNNIQ